MFYTIFESYSIIFIIATKFKLRKLVCKRFFSLPLLTPLFHTCEEIVEEFNLNKVGTAFYQRSVLKLYNDFCLKYKNIITVTQNRFRIPENLQDL